MSTRRTLPSPVSDNEAAKPDAKVETPDPSRQLVTATSLGLWVRFLISKKLISRSRKASKKGLNGSSESCFSNPELCESDALLSSDDNTESGFERVFRRRP